MLGDLSRNQDFKAGAGHSFLNESHKECDADVGWHWDRDYVLEDSGVNLHPMLGTVTYLSGEPPWLGNSRGLVANGHLGKRIGISQTETRSGDPAQVWELREGATLSLAWTC